MSRPRWIGLGALLLLLSLLPFVPHGGDDPGAIRNAGEAAAPPRPRPLTAGYGTVTSGFGRTIDRVVAAGLSVGRVDPAAAPATLVDDVVRCAVFEGQRYCLGTGWTDRTPAGVRASLATLGTRRAARTGVNPRTGEKVDIPAGKVPKFTAGSSLKSAVK